MQFSNTIAVAVITRPKKTTSPYTRRTKQYACQTKQSPIVALQSYLKTNIWKKNLATDHTYILQNLQVKARGEKNRLKAGYSLS